MNSLVQDNTSSEIDALWEAIRAHARGGPEPIVPESSELSEFASLYLPVAAPARTPFVLGQLGQSLDGYIATKTGASHYITGPKSLVHLHRLRALVDAVVVGWRTVPADDPLLTVRHVGGENPLRAIVDIAGRLPANARAFSREAPGALRLIGPDVPPLSGIESITVPLHDGRYRPQDIVSALARRGYRRILIEGGGATVSDFLEAGALTRLHIAVAPLIIGEGRRGITLPGVPSLDAAMRPRSRHYRMGDEVLFDLDLAQ